MNTEFFQKSLLLIKKNEIFYMQAFITHNAQLLIISRISFNSKFYITAYVFTLKTMKPSRAVYLCLLRGHHIDLYKELVIFL